ncbi:helix-turn-helix domain-containing protein [Paraburkholderia sp. B3]|uniref:AraC family transcriptional regulator n=1 Tax=Paraburkholderia sp. B3 TaxID=3134791 RepID=UPI003981C61B
MRDKIRRGSDKSQREEKSLDPGAYQSVPRVITGMARNEATGGYIPAHSHPRGQLLYATSGLMRAATENGIWLLPPQRGLWIPAHVVHDQLMLSPTLIRTVYIEPAVSRRFGNTCRTLEIRPLLRELILALLAEPVEYALTDRNLHIVDLILSELDIAPSLAVHIPWPRDRRLLSICESILDAPHTPMTIDYWSERVGASARTLIRLFIRETGLTFRQWVQQVRLAEALSRLAHGDPVFQIAEELGYASPSAFSAMFRQVMGQAPTDYLQERP